MPYINAYAHVAQSAFESAIDALNPLAWYRFREDSFATAIEDSSGNNYDLTKQIATAARSAVPTRTTHPGGAYFPAVTKDNWATLGTFYKGTTGLLNGVSDYTLLVSVRIIQGASTDVQKVFGIGTENVGATASNDLVMMSEFSLAVNDGIQSRKCHSGGSAIIDTLAATGIVEDGVSRLYITRLDAGTLWQLTSSKPGHEMLTEETGNTTGPLDALNLALILNARSETASGSATTTGMIIDQAAIWASDIGATAEADLHSKWCDEVAGAGYYPSMMDFDGSTGFYSDTYTSTGNKVAAVIRFMIPTFTGGSAQVMLQARSTVPTQTRIQVTVYANDHATASRRQKVQMFVQNSTGTGVASIWSSVVVTDGAYHMLLCAYDGDAGTAVMYLDGVDVKDTGNAEHNLTTGTLGATAASTFRVGSTSTPSLYFSGEIGSVGHHDAYLTNYADFMDGNLPKAIDEKNWTEWGAQPLYWSHTGEMTNNKGSAGDMTLNGSVVMTEGGSP